MKLGDRLYTNALSRSYDIMICDLCGTDEAKMTFMGAPKPLAHWACLQPQHQKDFKALPAEQAIQKIKAGAQLDYLMELYRLWLQYPVNTDWEACRLDAHEHCPGLTTLWYDTTLNLKTFDYPLTTSNAFDHICRQQTYGFA